jgi:hypothetical protein
MERATNTPRPADEVAAKVTRATALYRQVMVEVERRRLQLGWPAWELDDVAGTQDGHFMKCLWADTPSGRQARWETVQLLLDAMFPLGFDLIIKPKKNGCVFGRPSQQQKIREAKATVDRKTYRELQRERGLAGGAARAKKLSKKRRIEIAKQGARARARQLPKEQRSEQARLAALARWHKPEIIEVTPHDVIASAD